MSQVPGRQWRPDSGSSASHQNIGKRTLSLPANGRVAGSIALLPRIIHPSAGLQPKAARNGWRFRITMKKELNRKFLDKLTEELNLLTYL
jgi:hypothetical protein